MVKGLLVLGMVRLRKVSAELIRCKTLDRSGSSKLAAIKVGVFAAANSCGGFERGSCMFAKLT